MKKLILTIIFLLIPFVSHSQWEVYNSENSILPNSPIKKIVVDKNNTVWVLADSGLVSINGDEWILYDPTKGNIPYSYIQDIAVNKKGEFFIASNGYILKFDNNSFEIVDSLPDIKFLDFDSKGNYWVSTRESILKKEGDKWVTKYTEKSYDLETVRMIVDNEDRVWLSRLFYIDVCQLLEDGTIYCFSENDSKALKKGMNSRFALDSNGSIWFGSRNAILGYNGTDWFEIDSLEVKDNEYGGRYRAIGFDKENNLWAVSNLNFNDVFQLIKIGKKIEVFELDSNLLPVDAYNWVRGLAIDLTGNVWIASTMGLIKFTPTKTNIELGSEQETSIYPNPTNGIVNIKSSNSKNTTEIYNLLGEKIISTDNERIDLSNFQKGVYIIRVSNSNGTSSQKLILK